jgi:hypothetical protein
MGFLSPKSLDIHIFLKLSFFYNVKEISFNDVHHTSIGPHLTPAFKEFVAKSQILNLTPAFSFDHNSCKSSINEQYEGNLNICTSRPF